MELMIATLTSGSDSLILLSAFTVNLSSFKLQYTNQDGPSLTSGFNKQSRGDTS